jgi:acetyl-CoA acetyltransferase
MPNAEGHGGWMIGGVTVMVSQVSIAGVGMVPFTLAECGASLDAMAAAAIREALADAGLDVDMVDQAFVSHGMCDPIAGERILRQVGISEIPVANVSSSGASAAMALYLARQAVLSGQSECVLALGIDGREASKADELSRTGSACIQLANLLQTTGVEENSLARLVVNSRNYAAHNTNAIFRTPLSVADVLAEPALPGGLYKSCVSVPASGAAAVIVCSPVFAKRFGLRSGVSILAHEMRSDWSADADDGNPLGILGGRSIARAADAAYDSAGIGPEEVDVAEVDDGSVGNEMIAFMRLGLCAESDVNGFVSRISMSAGAGVVVNPSGGMLALGDAPGATGLAQIVELTKQLRGEAGARQAPAARTALQQSGGFGGAVSVAILQVSVLQ